MALLFLPSRRAPRGAQTSARRALRSPAPRRPRRSFARRPRAARCYLETGPALGGWPRAVRRTGLSGTTAPRRPRFRRLAPSGWKKTPAFHAAPEDPRPVQAGWMLPRTRIPSLRSKAVPCYCLPEATAFPHQAGLFAYKGCKHPALLAQVRGWPVSPMGEFMPVFREKPPRREPSRPSGKYAFRVFAGFGLKRFLPAFHFASARGSYIGPPRRGADPCVFAREMILSAALERWPSGRWRTPGKCVGGEPSRGFESLSLRQDPQNPFG